jgi:hypothetical protein
MNQIKKAYLELAKSIIQNHEEEQYRAFNKLCVNLEVKTEAHKDILFDYCFNNKQNEESKDIIDSYL